jgi:hypothetical protein
VIAYSGMVAEARGILVAKSRGKRVRAFRCSGLFTDLVFSQAGGSRGRIAQPACTRDDSISDDVHMVLHSKTRSCQR